MENTNRQDRDIDHCTYILYTVQLIGLLKLPSLKATNKPRQINYMYIYLIFPEPVLQWYLGTLMSSTESTWYQHQADPPSLLLASSPCAPDVAIAAYSHQSAGWYIYQCIRLILCQIKQFCMQWLHIYSGTHILRPPIHPEKCSLKVEVVLNWRDVSIENTVVPL